MRAGYNRTCGLKAAHLLVGQAVYPLLEEGSHAGQSLLQAGHTCIHSSQCITILAAAGQTQPVPHKC